VIGTGTANRAANHPGDTLASIFSLSAFFLFLAFAVFGLAVLGIALVALGYFRRQAERNAASIPVTTFVSAIATAWALSLGFAAADVWSIRAQAEQAASEERSAIGRLAGMASPDALDSENIMQSLSIYRAAFLEKEWKQLGNRDPAPEVDQALQQIRLEIIALARSQVPATLVAKMTRDFDELQDARNKRIAIGETSVSEYKWYLVLFLTILSMIAMAAVHADRPPAGRNALAVFAVAAAVSLWILALHANPYIGPAPIQFDPIGFPV
jgi:hypothetical protein